MFARIEIKKTLPFGLALLALAACEDSGYAYGPSPETPASTDPAVTIVAPARGGALASGTVQVRLRTRNVAITAPGVPLKDGEGHIHVYLDKPASSPAYDAVIKEGTAGYDLTLPLTVEPGNHYLIVALQRNDHSSYGVQDSVAFTVGGSGGAGNDGGYDNGYGY